MTDSAVQVVNEEAREHKTNSKGGQRSMNEALEKI
jgi:hypothetical protein